MQRPNVRMLQFIGLAIIAALAVGLVPEQAAASAAAPTKSESVFRLRPGKDRVDVRVTMSITNRKPDSFTTGPCRNAPSRRCRITTRYYYTGMGFFLDSAARNIKFKGTGVSARVVKKTRGWRVYTVKFSPVSRGQTRQIRVTYQLPAARPRSANTTRVTDAYAHLCWYGQATDTGSVTALLPRGYDTSTRYGQVRKKKTKGGLRLRAVRKRNPGKFYACTDAFDPSKLLRTETTSQNGRKVTVEGWPEDPAWTTSITTGIETTLPALEQLIGIRFPTDDVAIRQVASQALAGYAGDFDPRSGMIRVSEQLDDEQLVAHELAHAWFNFGTLKEAWMVEGLADWAGYAVADGECKDPGEYPGKGSPRLQDWRHIEGNPSDRDVKVIGYQYATACTITETIADAIGEERMPVVIRSLLYRMPKYKGDWSREQGRPAWREWLDAVDEIGLVPAGVSDLEMAERLLVEQGIARKKELKGRSEARAAYHEAANGPLADAMPLVVREAMDAWKWDKAAKGITIATETRKVAQRLRGQGVTGSPVELVGSRLVEARSLAELKEIRKEILAVESAQVAR